LAKVAVEIIALVVFPFELLMLHTVFAKLHGIDLGIGQYGDTHQSQY
jgi:hypothetical protein